MADVVRWVEAGAIEAGFHCCCGMCGAVAVAAPRYAGQKRVGGRVARVAAVPQRCLMAKREETAGEGWSQRALEGGPQAKKRHSTGPAALKESQRHRQRRPRSEAGQQLAHSDVTGQKGKKMSPAGQGAQQPREAMSQEAGAHCAEDEQRRGLQQQLREGDGHPQDQGQAAAAAAVGGLLEADQQPGEQGRRAGRPFSARSADGRAAR